MFGVTLFFMGNWASVNWSHRQLVKRTNTIES